MLQVRFRYGKLELNYSWIYHIWWECLLVLVLASSTYFLSRSFYLTTALLRRNKRKGTLHRIKQKVKDGVVQVGFHCLKNVEISKCAMCLHRCRVCVGPTFVLKIEWERLRQNSIHFFVRNFRCEIVMWLLIVKRVKDNATILGF